MKFHGFCILESLKQAGDINFTLHLEFLVYNLKRLSIEIKEKTPSSSKFTLQCFLESERVEMPTLRRV